MVKIDNCTIGNIKQIGQMTEQTSQVTLNAFPALSDLNYAQTTWLATCTFMHTNGFIVCFQAFNAMDQLRTHCATEIAALERSVGSQQQLLSVLQETYPEQVKRRG